MTRLYRLILVLLLFIYSFFMFNKLSVAGNYKGHVNTALYGGEIVLAKEKDASFPTENIAFQKSELHEDVRIDLLELKNMDIVDVLKLISQKCDLNIVAGAGVKGKVSIFLKEVQLKDALRIILDVNNLAYTLEDGIIRVVTAKEFEMLYGYKFGTDIRTQIIHLTHANVADVANLLNQIKSNGGKIIADVKTNTMILIDIPEKVKEMEDVIKKIDFSTEMVVFELSYAKASEMESKIGEILTANVGQVRIDERSNKIIVKDSAAKIKEVQEIIEEFDVQEREVFIEAKIIQIVLSDEFKLGIDWEALVSKYQDMELTANFDILSGSDKGGTLNIATLADDDYTVVLEALESIGDTDILSSPSITALNNQPARILVGSSEPYVTTTTTTPSSGPTTTAESINFIDVGVKLYVTPTIHKDDFVTMSIQPEVSSVTKTITTSINNTIPVVETSEAETIVRVKDGVTIMIGGLIKEEKIESINKVPILGSIPILGYAFRNQSTLKRKTEIVIFLKPSIITGDVEGTFSKRKPLDLSK